MLIRDIAHAEWLAVMTGLRDNHTQTNKKIITEQKQFLKRICKMWKLESFSCFVENLNSAIVKEQKAGFDFVVEHCDITRCKQSPVKKSGF